MTFYNQLWQNFSKRQQEILAICKTEKESLEKLEKKAKKREGRLS